MLAWLRCSILLPLIWALGGCAQAPLRLNADPAAGQAVLLLPEQVEVATVNGVEIENFKRLIGAGSRELALAPGRYDILAYYHEIWTLGDNHDTVMSDPARFTLDARDGHRYTIEYVRPDDHAAARRLAADFSGELVDTTSGERRPSTPSGLAFRRGITGYDRTLVAASQSSANAGRQQTIAPLAPAPAVAPSPQPPGVIEPAPGSIAAGGITPGAAPTLPPAPAPAREWLPMMQAWWQQATAEERRAFLAWIAAQP